MLFSLIFLMELFFSQSFLSTAFLPNRSYRLLLWTAFLSNRSHGLLFSLIVLMDCFSLKSFLWSAFRSNRSDWRSWHASAPGTPARAVKASRIDEIRLLLRLLRQAKSVRVFSKPKRMELGQKELGCSSVTND